jgi:hypothetical protein
MAQTVPQTVFGVIFFAACGSLLVFGVVKGLRESDGARAAGAWLGRAIGRGWAAIAAGRVVLTRTIHLQQARLTRDAFELGPVDLGGPDHLSSSWLGKVARSEIADLVAALSAAQAAPDNPGRDRALACYDAAALLAAEREDRLDLLGAIVLAREGQTALADRDPLPRPVCQVHPLHGPALRRPRPGQRSRPPGKLPATCAGCKGCSIAERDQRALRAGDVPYYRIPGFWTSVGFGALDADLPARVLEYLSVE